MDVRWSPYQKLVLAASNAGPSRQMRRSTGSSVNNTGYQAMIDLNERTVASDPESYPPAMRGLSQYDIPFLLHPSPRRRLMRRGRDAATTRPVRCGTASSGSRPSRSTPRSSTWVGGITPSSPTTHRASALVNDDARSFFATCRDRFDVISFGLARLAYDHRDDQCAARPLCLHQGKPCSTHAPCWPMAESWCSASTPRSRSSPTAWHARCARCSARSRSASAFPRSPYGWGGVMFIAGDLDRRVEADRGQSPAGEDHRTTGRQR